MGEAKTPQNAAYSHIAALPVAFLPRVPAISGLSVDRRVVILARMHPRFKKILLVAVKFALPVAIVTWLLWRIDSEQWQELGSQPKSFPLLIAAFVIAFSGIVISFARWAILVRCQGIRLGTVDAFRLGAIGFLLSFVSAGSVGGDLFKAIFLARRSPGKRFEAVASVLVDRAVGLYGLLLVAVAVLVVVPPMTASEELRQISRGAAALAALGTVVLVALVAGGKSIDRLLRRLGNLPKVGPLVHRLADPLRMFHTHPLAFFAAILMSVLVHLLLAASMYLIARGLFAAPPTFAEHLIIMPVGMLASALPLTPAGVGVLEATIEWLYQVVPATPTGASGTLVALTFELVKILLAACGLAFYWGSDPEIRQSLEAAEQEVEAEIDGEPPAEEATAEAIR